MIEMRNVFRNILVEDADRRQKAKKIAERIRALGPKRSTECIRLARPENTGRMCQIVGVLLASQVTQAAKSPAGPYLRKRACFSRRLLE
jgi:hypothetical protein